MKKRFIVILTCALAVMLLLRFWNLDKRVIFDWDQESYANAVYSVANGDITLLGPRTTHDKGFFLGPHFTYLMLPFYAATDLHPAGSILFLIVVNLLFAVIGTFVLKKLFDWRVAAFFFLFWAFHSWMVEYDVIPWWPVLLPAGILGTVFLLSRCAVSEKPLPWFSLGLLAGLMMNMHFQYVFVLFFAGVFLIRHWISKRRIPWKQCAIAAAGFAIMFLPLLIFDFRHGFMNGKLFLNFFFADGTSGAIKTWNNWIPVFSNFSSPFTGTQAIAAGLVWYAVVLATVWGNLRKAEGFRIPFYTALLALWVSIPVFFAIYGQRPSEYYFIYTLPFSIISVVDLFGRMKAELLLFGLTAVYIAANVAPVSMKLETHPYGLYRKEQLVRYLDAHFDQKTYIVSFNVELGREPGFRYLMEHYGIVTHDKGDNRLPLVQVKIPPEAGDVRISDQLGLQIPPELKNAQ